MEKLISKNISNKFLRVKIPVYFFSLFVLGAPLTALAQAPNSISFQAVIRMADDTLFTSATPITVKAQYLGYDSVGSRWCAIHEEGFAVTIPQGVLSLRLGTSTDVLSTSPITLNGSAETAQLLRGDSTFITSGVTHLSQVLSASQINWATRCSSTPNLNDIGANWTDVASGQSISSSGRALRLWIKLNGSDIITPVFNMDSVPYAQLAGSANILSGSMGASSNQILKWNGSVWTPSAIDTSEIANEAIDATKLSSDSVTSTKIADGSVGNSKISDVDWSKIANTPTTLSGYGITDTISTLLPSQTGQSGKFLSTDGSNLAWSDAGSGSGTVTEVTSANSYLSVATGTTTPALTLNVGTGANTVAAGDDSRIVNAVQQSAYATDLADVATCTGAQKPSWNTVSDKWECVAISGFATTATAFVQGGNSFGATAVLGTDDANDLSFETGGSARMTVKSDGKVGVGTASPSKFFDVRASDAQFKANSSSFRLYLSKLTSTDTGSILFQTDNTSIAEVGTSGDEDFKIRMHDGTNFVNSLLIKKSNRYVGIGISDPEAPLHIGGSIRQTTEGNNQVHRSLVHSDTASHNAHFIGMRYRGVIGSPAYPQNGDSIVSFQGRNSDDIHAGISIRASEDHNATSAGMDMLFITPTNGTITPTTKMIIQDDGKVGIGTTTPNQMLTVNGSQNITNGSLGINNTSADSLSQITLANDAQTYSIAVSGTSGDIFGIYDNTNPGFKFAIQPVTGNIGIGTISPSAKLQVAGQIVSSQNTISSGATVNFASGNTQVLDSVGGSAITLQNMVHGGSYMLVVRDTTSRTYTFSGCNSSYYSPSNGATQPGTRTTYAIMAIQNGVNTECYISWITGFN